MGELPALQIRSRIQKTAGGVATTQSMIVWRGQFCSLVGVQATTMVLVNLERNLSCCSVAMAAVAEADESGRPDTACAIFRS